MSNKEALEIINKYGIVSLKMNGEVLYQREKHKEVSHVKKDIC